MKFVIINESINIWFLGEAMILLMMMDDSEDRTKFCILYEKYRYLLQKVAMDVLNDRYLAEDAVQNAFMKIADSIEKIGEIDSRQTKSYLVVTAKNEAIDIYRKRNKQIQKEVDTDEVEEDKMPAAYMETDIENGVLNILKNLPEKYKDIFLLKYSAELENSEIAKVCGIKEATVRQRIARGKVMIENEIRKLEVNVYAADRSN